MVDQPGFFGTEARLRALSAAHDPLERLKTVVDFELFRADLEAALSRADRSRGSQCLTRLQQICQPARPLFLSNRWGLPQSAGLPRSFDQGIRALAAVIASAVHAEKPRISAHFTQHNEKY